MIRRGTIEKLMRVANDPAATPAERAAYRAKAEAMQRMPEQPPRRTLVELYRAGIFHGEEHDATLKYEVAQRWPTTYARGYAVTCCCTGAGKSMEECGASRNLKHPCRCRCHPRKERKRKS